jgi:hypothetical protein
VPGVASKATLLRGSFENVREMPPPNTGTRAGTGPACTITILGEIERVLRMLPAVQTQHQSRSRAFEQRGLPRPKLSESPRIKNC